MVAETELPQQLLGALVDLGMLLIQRHPMPGHDLETSSLQKNRLTNPSDFCCLVIVNKGAARIKSLGSRRHLLQVLFFLRDS